ncbi:MAG: CpsD/CapB family tyrosine-protein kinase, partial [Chloroflexi bacterium]|nr:CpsD/CapB family tyrosine-protein kinase [Chloroflexota bacterium]
SMLDLIQHLQSLADLIIIAAPPFQEQAEGIVLASRVNGAMVAAMYGQTRRREVREVMEDLYSLGAQVIGTVLMLSGKRSRRPRFGRRRSRPVAVETVGVPPLSQSEHARKGAG